MTPRTGLRRAGEIAIMTLATACHPPESTLAGAGVSALGARDGYVFVISPFNCFLGQRQIDALNAIGYRTRRTGVILATGDAAENDSSAALAVERLGIRMRTRRLTGTSLSREFARLGLRPPIVIAIRRGEIIGLLRGEQAEKLDSWIAWLEQQIVMPHAE